MEQRSFLLLGNLQFRQSCGLLRAPRCLSGPRAGETPRLRWSQQLGLESSRSRFTVSWGSASQRTYAWLLRGLVWASCRVAAESRMCPAAAVGEPHPAVTQTQKQAASLLLYSAGRGRRRILSALTAMAHRLHLCRARRKVLEKSVGWEIIVG